MVATSIIMNHYGLHYEESDDGIREMAAIFDAILNF